MSVDLDIVLRCREKETGDEFDFYLYDGGNSKDLRRFLSLHNVGFKYDSLPPREFRLSGIEHVRGDGGDVVSVRSTNGVPAGYYVAREKYSNAHGEYACKVYDLPVFFNFFEVIR